MSNKKRDVILIGVLLAVAAALSLFLFLSRQIGAKVVVSVDGQEMQTFSLNENITYLIETEGGGENLLVIDSGEVFLEDANCPDHLCVNQGTISYDGQSIVCLPHKVVVTVVSEGNEQGVDAVAK